MGFSGFLTPLHSRQLALVECLLVRSIRGFDVPAAEVELGHGYETLDGVLDFSQG
jgi:hypothetical protein